MAVAVAKGDRLRARKVNFLDGGSIASAYEVAGGHGMLNLTFEFIGLRGLSRRSVGVVGMVKSYIDCRLLIPGNPRLY